VVVHRERAETPEGVPVDKTITFDIQSPRGRKTFTFDKTDKVAEVIEKARIEFGFEPGTFVLKRGDEALAVDRPLVSYHIADGELLMLVPEMGSGV
jgi:hypothetical protein